MFKKKEVKNKVGRPKLADTKLKKESLIVSLVCVIFSVALLFIGAYELNIIPNTSKLKGSVNTNLCTSIPEELITSKNKMGILNAANDLIKANLSKRPLVELGFYFKDANFYIPETDLTPDVFLGMVMQYKTIIDFLDQPLSEETESTTEED